MKEGWFYRNLYGDVFTYILKKPLYAGAMVVLDGIFLAVWLYLQRFIAVVMPQNAGQSGMLSSIGIFLLIALDFFILVFLYSLFKYCILHFMRRMDKSVGLKFDKLMHFYGINLALIAIFTAFYLSVGGFLQSGLRTEFVRTAAMIIAVPYLLFSYTWLNIAHSLFAKSWGTSKVLRNSFSFMFRKIPSYRSVYFFSAAVLLALATIYYLAGIGLGKFGWDAGAFVRFFAVFSSIVLYCLMALNRIGFYLSVKKVH